MDATCEVVSDALHCFTAVTDAGCSHQAIKTGSGSKASKTPAFKWVNTALGNIKAAITGTYRSIRQKHVPRYLAEFEYRTPPHLGKREDNANVTYRLLKLAEHYA
ncbi:hypothetical protein BMW22_35870 (plasmid) [Rhizobium leguminosarum]|uniref:ISXO2-like transposase domain-containing protein n=1 Tax=Rhizobium leguminosarum TaxID=384 RepID=A0A1L3ZMF6_RHILE|nr:transposase [Rhizobium leguminosarum]API56791.1 hypothetical protein BMW22_35870 [Rhizobium leguminosarum]